MRFLIVLGFLYLSLAASVLELTDLTFQETIENNPIVLVLFYSNWCSTCKKVKADFDATAKLAASFKKSYLIARIDGSSQTEVADRVNISDFPLIILYVNQKRIDYGKGKDNIVPEELIRFIDKKVRPPSVELTMKEEIEGFKNSKGTKCLLISNDNTIQETYIEVAKKLIDIPFYHMTEERGKEYFSEIEKFPAVIFSTSENYVLDSGLTTEGIRYFIELNRFPPLTDLTKDVAGQILKPSGRIGIIFFMKTSHPNFAKYKEEFSKVAAKQKSLDKLFSIAQLDNDLHARILKFLGYDESYLPLIVIIKKDVALAKYRYKGEYTEEEIGKFVEDFMAEKIEEDIKSEEIPKENKGPVYKVVGKTFKDEVINSDMDVFVKFYAPWCGHCKTLAPVYEELAEKLKEGNKLKFVEIDSSVNEVPGHSISSYPTLKLFLRNDRENPREYMGNRKLESMLEFLKTNCVEELIVKDTVTTSSTNESDYGGKCGSSCKDNL